MIFAPPYTPANTTQGNTVILNSGNPGLGLLAFPYVFPGAYSKAQALSSDAYGWIHAPAPYSVDTAGNTHQFDTQPLLYLQYLNHNPVDVGDNLPTPPNAIQGGGSDWQTWWGFPIWRETLSPSWADPAAQINVLQLATNSFTQPPGLIYTGVMSIASGQLVPTNPNLLPPMADPSSNFGANFAIFRQNQQSFCDGAGGNSLFWGGANVGQVSLWTGSWEDDLIMTGVRSFDIKAYDNALANYADLGWADDIRQYLPYQGASGVIIPTTPPGINGTPSTLLWPPISLQTNPLTPTYGTLGTMAHEGRMPPLQADNRLDYQNPNASYVNQTTYNAQYPLFPNYSSNVGDDSKGIVRLRRVWDTWSTDYAQAPATSVNATNGGYPVGPPYGTPPIYPSYPPPYPAVLRGIQIQIRVVDPTNQRIKSLTIREDFTDKL